MLDRGYAGHWSCFDCAWVSTDTPEGIEIGTILDSHEGQIIKIAAVTSTKACVSRSA